MRKKMHRQPDFLCLIDGAKVGRKILLGEKMDGKVKLRKVNRKVGTKKRADRKETVKLP